MRRNCIGLASGLALLAAALLADGPYKVLKTAKVGGLGGWDYLYADAAHRRLYIPRGAAQGDNPQPARIAVFDLDTLAPAGEIPNVRANGVAVDAKSGHGFASSKPVTMWDAKTLQVIKTIDVDPKCQPDGIVGDPYNQRIYVLSHPTHDATVIDAKDGTVLGTIDLGGAPEEGVPDGKGRLYVVIQDKSNVAVVDVKTMKVTAHYDFAEKAGRCNGLALDTRNHVLFAACAQAAGAVAGSPPSPTMVILNAQDGKILNTVPLAGGSDGAVFNPSTMEAFSSQGNGTMTIVKETGPGSFEKEQDLQTMNGARTITLDPKTHHIFTMSAEFGPPPPAPPAPPEGQEKGRGGRGRGSRGPMLPGSFTIVMVGK